MSTRSTRIGQKVRAARALAGLTQEALAIKAGVVSATISRLERGLTQYPRGDELERIAAALDSTPEQLIGEGETPPSAPRNASDEDIFEQLGPEDAEILKTALRKVVDRPRHDRRIVLRVVADLIATFPPITPDRSV